MKTNSLTAWYASIKAAGEAKPLQAISVESKQRSTSPKQGAPRSVGTSQASIDLISSSVFK